MLINNNINIMTKLFNKHFANKNIWAVLICSLFLRINSFGQNIPNINPPLNNSTSIQLPSAYPSGIVVNKIKTYTPRKRLKIEAAVTNPIDYKNISLNTAVIDGFGRPIQEIQRRIMTNSTNSWPNDLVTPHTYNEFGEELIQFLPYAVSSDGDMRLNPFNEQNSFYTSIHPEDHNFYSKKEIDYTSLSSEVKIMKPGDNWAGLDVGVTLRNSLNIEYEVRIWEKQTTGIPISTSFYEANQIFIKETINEEGKQKREYYDKQGKIILSKVENGSTIQMPTPGGPVPYYLTPVVSDHQGWLCTYFIYDELDRLRNIVSPKAVEYLMNNNWVFNVTISKELCTYFEYDFKGRLVTKKSQGMIKNNIIYDSKDRPVLVQTGNMKTANTWLFNKYDINNRVILSGRYNNPSGLTKLILISEIENTSPTSGSFFEFINSNIVNNTFDKTSILPDADIFSINYFDQLYNLPIDFDFDPTLFSPFGAGNSEPHTPTLEAKGLNFGGHVRIMNGNIPTNQWKSSIVYYDNLGRILQCKTKNQENGLDVISNNYNYQGQIIASLTTINNPNAIGLQTITQEKRYVFDNYGNLTMTYCRTNDEPNFRILNRYYFDELGRVSLKKLGYLIEEQNFKYKPTGELVAINGDYCNTGLDDHFFWEIISTNGGFNNNKLDGSIAGFKWRMKGSNTIQRAYGYSYDPAGRLKEAYYSQEDSQNPNVWTNTAENYTATNMNYDANGNLNSMTQWGTKVGIQNPFIMDELTYSYKDGGLSNRLKNVTDNITVDYQLGEFKELGSHPNGDYNYDANGNAVTDYNKNIEAIEYNFQNKPTKITFTPNPTTRIIEFSYDALGERLAKKVIEGE
jgi:hypothetical protein